MPNYRHQQIPGIDHLGRQIDERITAKQCQSVVNQFGKRMLSELYGVAGGGLSFEDRKGSHCSKFAWALICQSTPFAFHHGCASQARFSSKYFLPTAMVALNPLVDDGRVCV